MSLGGTPWIHPCRLSSGSIPQKAFNDIPNTDKRKLAAIKFVLVNYFKKPEAVIYLFVMGLKVKKVFMAMY